MTAPFSAQDALIAAMILTAAADAEMSVEESRIAGVVISTMPALRGFDERRFGEISAVVVEMLGEDDGIDQCLTLIDEALPDHLRETAYALACDISAADGEVALEEARLLEMLRHRLRIDRLNAAAIERGARARFTPL